MAVERRIYLEGGASAIVNMMAVLVLIPTDKVVAVVSDGIRQLLDRSCHVKSASEILITTLIESTPIHVGGEQLPADRNFFGYLGD